MFREQIMPSSNIRDVVPPADEIEAGDGPPSPATILRAQAERWTERTKGEIVAEVEPTRASSDKLVYWFSFVVPALDGYRHRLFRIEYGLDYYPVRISKGRMEHVPTEVPNEDELYAELQRLFTAPETLSIVRQLRSMVGEQRAPGAAR